MLRAVANSISAASGNQAAQITAAQSLGVPYILAKSAIPFVGVSSGTCSAAGAVTALTALPVQYSGCWIYLPANKAATTIAAGWFWFVPSSTTAGTIYLNQPTATFPIAAPTSLTPCTTASSWTGDTGEEFLPGITVPANAMGNNGSLDIGFSITYNNTANNKTQSIRFSGNGGTVIYSAAFGSATTFSVNQKISNKGAANSQSTWWPSGTTTYGSNTTNPLVRLSVDTTQASTLVITIQRATATDHIVVESLIATLLSDGT